MSAIPQTRSQATRLEPENELNYLNVAHGPKSWFFTTDRKRIGILYLYSILVFFIIASIAAAPMRIELLTPAGDLVQSETYNKLLPFTVF